MCNKEMINKMVRGELTCTEAYELENRLYTRSEKQIIEDLKELPFESLLNTRDCIESGIENNPELDKEEVRKSLRYLETAISERVDEMISAEKQVKEILCT